MVYGISNTLIGVALLTLLLGVGSTALYYRRVVAGAAKDVRELEKKAQENLTDESAGYGVTMPTPDVGRTPIDIFRAWRHLAVEARMAKRGYVKWFRVGARLYAPKWVKPEHKDSGQMEYEHDGTTYIFPEDAMVTDGRTSAYVAVHKEGEAEPIDLRDPGWATLDTSAVDKLVQMKINDDPPGALSGLPLSKQQLYYVGMAVAAIGIWLVMQTGVVG
jgi:hypothetical protein